MTTKQLVHKATVSVHPEPPFSFVGTVHKPSNFPTTDRMYKGNEYWQSFNWNDTAYGIKMIDVGTFETPNISLEIYSDLETDIGHHVDEIVQEIEFRFDLKSDYSPFLEGFATDPIVGSAIKKWNGMRVSSPYSLYEFLLVTTVLQNTTVKRSFQMMSNLFERFGSKILFDGRELSTFWSAKSVHVVGEEELRELKVGYRAKTLKRQAGEFVGGKIDEFQLRTMAATELKTNLLDIYGVGPASVQYLMFEKFHQYHICDRIPPWEQKIYSRLLFDKELVGEQQLLDEIERRWGEWKMLAMHYLFENLFWLRKTNNIEWLEALILL